MEQCFSPLDRNFYGRGDPTLTGDLAEEGRFAEGGRVVCTPKGSMDTHVLPLFIHHMNEFVRRFIPKTVFYLLTLDGCGSRKGAEWVQGALDAKCEVVLAPANTSHFVQPCDQDINKGFKLRIREVRDDLMHQNVTDTKSVRLKLMCGVEALQNISIEHCAISFAKTGLYRFQRDFAKRFQREIIEVMDNKSDGEHDDETADAQTLRLSLKICENRNREDPARVVQRLVTFLSRRRTTNSVLLGLQPP